MNTTQPCAIPPCTAPAVRLVTVEAPDDPEKSLTYVHYNRLSLCLVCAAALQRLIDSGQVAGTTIVADEPLLRSA